MRHRLTIPRGFAALGIFLAIGAFATALVAIPDERWFAAVGIAVVAAMVVVLGVAIKADPSKVPAQGRAVAGGVFVLIALASVAAGTATLAGGLPVLAGAALLGAAACLVAALRVSIGR